MPPLLKPQTLNPKPFAVIGYNESFGYSSLSPLSLNPKPQSLKPEPYAVLGFNESFSYSSLCPLSLDKEYLKNLPESRVLGSMEGSYLIVTGVRVATHLQHICNTLATH